MKKHITFFLLTLVTGISSLKAQTNIGSPADPDSSAQLQISSTTKGVLMPNISLTATTTFTLTGSGTPAQNLLKAGMVVYNTNTSITGTTSYPAYGAGLYTWDGTGWKGTPVVSATPTLPRMVVVAYGDTVGSYKGPPINYGFVQSAKPIDLSHVSATDGSVTISNNTITINTAGTYKFNVAMSFLAQNNVSNNSSVYFTLVNSLYPDDTFTNVPPNYSNQHVAWWGGTSGASYSQFLYTGSFPAGTKLYYDAQAIGYQAMGWYRIASLEIQRVN